MLTGMMHFRAGDSTGRRCARTRAMRTGRVDVRVVWCALQVCRKRVVRAFGRTRVWKIAFMGRLMEPPVRVQARCRNGVAAGWGGDGGVRDWGGGE